MSSVSDLQILSSELRFLLMWVFSALTYLAESEWRVGLAEIDRTDTHTSHLPSYCADNTLTSTVYHRWRSWVLKYHGRHVIRWSVIALSSPLRLIWRTRRVMSSGWTQVTWLDCATFWPIKCLDVLLATTVSRVVRASLHTHYDEGYCR